MSDPARPRALGSSLACNPDLDTWIRIEPNGTVLIDRPDQPLLGAGEATIGPTPAAIANAITHATGIHPRDVPFLRPHSFVLADGPGSSRVA